MVCTTHHLPTYLTVNGKAGPPFPSPSIPSPSILIILGRCSIAAANSSGEPTKRSICSCRWVVKWAALRYDSHCTKVGMASSSIFTLMAAAAAVVAVVVAVVAGSKVKRRCSTEMSWSFSLRGAWVYTGRIQPATVVAGSRHGVAGHGVTTWSGEVMKQQQQHYYCSSSDACIYLVCIM